MTNIANIQLNNSLAPPALSPANSSPTPAFTLAADSSPSSEASTELKEAFHDFVGQTFFGQMIQAMRSTQQPAAYFHGGRAEEIFQGQFDQVLAEKLSDASAEKIADPMFELFMMKRSS